MARPHRRAGLRLLLLCSLAHASTHPPLLPPNPRRDPAPPAPADDAPLPRARPSPRAAPSAAPSASLQWVVTHAMARELARLGYSADEIARLDPQRAAAIVQRAIARPRRGVPAAWNRAAASARRGAALRRAGELIARAALLAALAAPLLYEPCVRGRWRELDRRYDEIKRGLRRWSGAAPRRAGSLAQQQVKLFIAEHELGTGVVSRDGRRIPLDAAPVRVGNIADTGSGTIALGFDAFQRLVALDPHCVEHVVPLRSSIMSINGIGDGAHSSTSILFHVRLTLELGGSLFTHEDVPVCRAISGLLLGNDFNVATRASYHYEPFSKDGVDYDGSVVLNATGGQTPSKPIPFSCRPHPQFRSAFVAAADASPEAAPLPPTVDEAESIINSLNPIAYVDTRTVVPAWSEKIVAVRAPAALLEGYDVAILPLEDERREDVGVAVSPGMYRPDAKGMIHIRVVNASLRPVAIPMLTPLARFMIDPRQGDKDVEFSVGEILKHINIDPSCSDEDRGKIAKMLASRRRLFATKLGWAHAIRMTIETPRIDSGELPVPARNDRNRRSREEEATLKKFLDKQLAEKLIEPCRSPYSALPILIRKADWSPDNPSYRCVLDYRCTPPPISTFIHLYTGLYTF
ncbi:hypothetical protein AB1Y20_004748 [Prymnesium parvum]|uniref:Uncharacterized protein n=1 Tax=Prymnesium parvum TaxID=97485 RepID=A0AB34IXS3_PRYPA